MGPWVAGHTNALTTSPYPHAPGAGEIRFETPLGVLPYMTAASAAYRTQQALAYLAAARSLFFASEVEGCSTVVREARALATSVALLQPR